MGHATDTNLAPDDNVTCECSTCGALHIFYSEPEAADWTEGHEDLGHHVYTTIGL